MSPEYRRAQHSGIAEPFLEEIEHRNADQLGMNDAVARLLGSSGSRAAQCLDGWSNPIAQTGPTQFYPTARQRKGEAEGRLFLPVPQLGKEGLDEK